MRRGWWIVALALACATGDAWAEESFLQDPQAQALLDTAQRHFADERYDLAAAAIETAYGIEPHPKLLVAWGQAERLGGACERAIERYRAFLATEPPAEQAQQVWRYVGICEGQLKAPKPEPPPPPQLPPAPPPEPTPPPQPWYQDVAGGVLVGIGIAGALTGAALLISAHVEDGEAAEETSHDSFRSRIERASLQERGGIVAMSLGGGLLLAAIARYAMVATLSAEPDPPVISTLSLAPWIAPDEDAPARGWQGGLVLGGRF